MKKLKMTKTMKVLKMKANSFFPYKILIAIIGFICLTMITEFSYSQPLIRHLYEADTADILVPLCNELDFLETKSFSEWVDVYRNEQDSAYIRHSDLPDIEKGVAIHLAFHSISPLSKGRLTLTSVGQQWSDDYNNFINSDLFDTISYKIENDLPLDFETEWDYRFVVRAILAPLHGAGDDINIANLYARGYYHTQFTRNEIECMRFYYGGMPKKPTSGDYSLKVNHGQTEMKIGDSVFTDIIYPKGRFEPGDIVPNFSMLPFEEYEKSFSQDNSNIPFTLDAFLTVKLLEDYNDVFNSYIIEEKEGKTYLKNDFMQTEDQYPDLAVTSYDLLQNKKPVVLVLHKVTDTYDWYLESIKWQMLYPAFKDRMDFYILHWNNQPFQDYGGTKDMYGVDQTAFDGKLCYAGMYDEETSLALVKSYYYRRNPNYDIPVLYENNSGIVCRHVGATGVGEVIIMDTNKTQCADQMLARYKFCPPINRNNNGYVAPQIIGGYTNGYIFAFHYMIRYFKILESLNWLYDPSSDLLNGFYTHISSMPYEEHARYHINNGTVLSYDSISGKMVINGKIQNWKDPVKDIVTDHTIYTGPNTRVSEENLFGANLMEIKAGDVVTVNFRKKYETDKYIARSVFKHSADEVYPGNLYFLGAKVTGIDTINNIIQAAMSKPDTSVEWKGFAYWTEALNDGATEASKPKDFYYTISKRLCFGSDADRTFNVVLDDASRFSINGTGAQPSDLQKIKAGDHIIFSYDQKYDNTFKTTQDYYPEDIMIINDDIVSINSETHMLPEGFGNPPTINPVADIEVLEDTGLFTVPLSGITDGDGGSSIQSLIVNSDNINLINPIVTYNIGDTSGTINCSVPIDMTGSAKLTIIITDSTEMVTEETFKVSVIPLGGSLPTIDTISDISILEDATEQTVELTGISDGENGTAIKSVQVISDNTSLVDPALTYILGEQTGNIIFTVPDGLSGTATLTVTVTDSTDLEAEISFTINIIGVNDQPTIDDIADATIQQDAEGISVEITGIGDGENNTQNLTVTVNTNNPQLESVSNLMYNPGESVANYFFKPKPGLFGEVTVKITVQDDGGTQNGGIEKIEKYFTITVEKNTGKEIYEHNPENTVIYPNPAYSTITIEGTQGFTSILVSDITGRTALKKSFSSSTVQKTIDISMLKQGTYFIHVTRDNKVIARKVLIKN